MRAWGFCIFVIAIGCGGTLGEAEDLDAGDGGFQGTVDSSGGFDGSGGGDGSVADTGNRCGKTLTGTLRDFREDHPDFEYVIGDDPGIVKASLGDDGKPVYASSGTTKTTTGKANFDQWYRDVDGVNKTFPFPITLSSGAGGVFTFSNAAFFPLDGKGWGNEGHEHNFHFTYELRTTFAYKGGETFEFTGDDDLFVFINKKLVIDLGGVHGAENAKVNLDARAGELGIEKGKVYSLDFFFAERHTSESTFRIDTTLDSVDCGTGIK